MPSTHLRLATLEAPLPDGLKSLSTLLTTAPIDVQVESGSTLYLPDLQALSPTLSAITSPLIFHADATVSRDSVLLRGFSAHTHDDEASVMASGNFYNLRQPQDIEFADVSFQIDATPTYVTSQLSKVGIHVSPKVEKSLTHLPKIRINGTADGHSDQGQADITIASAAGNAVIVADYTRLAPHIYNIEGHTDIDITDAGKFVGIPALSALSAHAEVALTTSGRGVNGNAELLINNCGFKGHTYRDVAVEATFDSGTVSTTLHSDNPDAMLHASALYSPVEKGVHSLKVDADVVALAPYSLSLTNSLPDFTLSTRLSADMQLDQSRNSAAFDILSGNLTLSDFALLDSKGDGISLRRADINLDSANPHGGLTIDSDILKGEINGYFVPQYLVADVMQIAHNCMPELQLSGEHSLVNELVYDFTIDNAEPLCRMLHLPVMPPIPLLSPVPLVPSRQPLLLPLMPHGCSKAIR